MLTELDSLKTEALSALDTLTDEAALEAFRIDYLGKKGKLTGLSAGMRDVPVEQKKDVGAKLNEVRDAITNGLATRKEALQAAKDAEAVAGIDLTLPGRPGAGTGTLHPLTQIRDLAVRTLRRMGFTLADGPEVETEWHCFDALNTPADHPARNESDTFYMPDGKLLRTHTSSVQIRTLETVKALPVRIIAPGAAYRRDEIDATHLSVFNQIEALFVDKDVSLADLKGTLEFFFREVFGPGTAVRFRPHFFPFTEPSFEIDVKLEAKGKEARWIEIAGCGMVDPAVFAAVSKSRGDDLFHPDQVTGFAFGMGLDRLAMILHGISDIRHLIENDVRFLQQF
ncbi:phenylalanine--tRNA ligase subunit alpha [Brevifollis gellanilyticus]|uniref:Phenylalanine--tRNA ligase alpha subunit n=1 Tax=Brevifollis gellanilyticus TaxID=748831 RepID=A0A512M3N5_9BACT|nr:phenylalanine--tRNA ligase subunit alpha [Brevifollis gellanilyticus]GEP41318.1 phenylalanine--tRNA ligase alpha subunit [Brevifollis gellanilyticus]